MPEKVVEELRLVFEAASRAGGGAGTELDTLDPATVAVLIDQLHPDVEFHEDPRFPEAGVYRGRDAVRAYWAQFTENFERFTFELEDVVPAGPDRALALFRLRATGKGSGAANETAIGWIYTVRDRRAVRIDAFFDRTEALAAARAQRA